MMFWGRSLVQEIYLLISIQSFFACACALCCRPLTLPLSGQGWNSAPKTARFWAVLHHVKGCGLLLGYWAWVRGSGLHGWERERRGNRCCIQLPVFMHSAFITARSLEIPSYFYSVFVIRIFSLCVPFFLEKSTSCAGTPLFVTLVQQAHTHKHTP